MEQTYLSRHERLGNNSATDNNITKVTLWRKTTIINTVAWFCFPDLASLFTQRLWKIYKQKGIRILKFTQSHAVRHHEQLVKPNPLDQCFLLHKPDQCSLRPLENINNIIGLEKLNNKSKQVWLLYYDVNKMYWWWPVWKITSWERISNCLKSKV